MPDLFYHFLIVCFVLLIIACFVGIAFGFIILGKEVFRNDAKATHSQTDCEKDEQGHEKPPC